MSEPTKKLVASVSLLLSTDPELVDCLRIEDKDNMKRWVVKRCKTLSNNSTMCSLFCSRRRISFLL